MIKLLLTTPDQHDFADPSVELDPRRLQRLLSGLPVLNLGESLRMVLNALEPLNEQKLDSRRRLKLLQIYLPAAARLYDTAEPLRLRQLPLSKQQRRAVIDDIERLCAGMANGFKIIIHDWFHQRLYEKQAGEFGRLMRWTVQQLGCLLVHNYRYYRPLPPFLFLELNQLYRLARHLGLHDQGGEQEPEGATLSLAANYAALALLSLTDPFHLAEGQVDACHRSLMQYAGRCRIIPGNSWKGVPEGLFFVDLISDSGPRPCVRLTPPVAAEDPHILDARQALQAMHAALAALPADRRRQRPEAGLLRALLPEVEAGDQRRGPRRADGRWLELVAGIDRIHAGLSQPPATAVSWRVKDASDAGYRLALEDSAAGELSAGELMYLRSDSGPQPASPQLLLVRWVRNARDAGTEIGVERLDGSPGPVRLVIDEAPQEQHPALFLTSAERPARLVAAKGVFQPGRALRILAGDTQVAVRCAECVAESPLIDCFEFTAQSSETDQ